MLCMWHGKRSKIVLAEPSAEIRDYTWLTSETLAMPFPLASSFGPSVSLYQH